MSIENLRERRQAVEIRIKQYASEVYATFTQDERDIMRFGLFPHDKTVAADAAILQELEWANESLGMDKSEILRLLAVGIMDAANAGPDKLMV